MAKLGGGGTRSVAGALVVGEGASIVGALNVPGDVVVEGVIEGELRCSALVIEANGVIEGTIVAEKAVVYGEVHGEIYALELYLRTGCAVEGQIYHQKLVLDEGCYFEGSSRRHAEPLKLAPATPPPVPRSRRAGTPKQNVA
jgi:cytoskeletal protein CcmA (bactofilin family)